MSKERLERIKERVNYHGHLDDDVEWLIEQAKRVQALEFYKQDWMLVTDQNKRYREALEFYADEDNYKTTGEKTYIGHGDYTEEIWIPVDVDSGKKARQALDGEE